MSRNFLVSSIVIVSAVLVWVAYEELERSRALAAQTNEIVKLPELPSPLTTNSAASDTLTVASANSPDTALTITSKPLTVNETATTKPNIVATTEAQSETPDAASEAPATKATDSPTSAPPSCSSFDEAGLVATFDNALSAFIADASTVYGNQYENLQYELSSKTAVITGEQGTVTTNYSGTVKELSAGQDVSANGTIRATFSWDGCVWTVIDYSF
jgi:hypothetical protein